MTLHLNHAPPKTVYKAWGFEHWHILSKDFCVKTIKLLKSHRTSYQFHRLKEEINFIRSGEAEVWLEDEAGVVQHHVLKAGDTFFVPVTRKHRVIALTDLEMFEVSNEHIDDVVRIDDEFGRKDGRIEAEHQTPAVLILAAGLGSRLKHLTATKNKALIPIGDLAVISLVIKVFPPDYEIVVAVGYKSGSLIDYCGLAHPERRFQFVEVQGWDDPKTDPGHSAWQCRSYLQRPFYLTAVDCLIDQPAPHIDGNWIGVHPTDYPEKYATVKVEGSDVKAVAQKRSDGFDQAFIGLAGVLDFSTFWSQLGASPTHELVSAWSDPSAYPTLRVKPLDWFDTGNLDDLSAARQYFGGTTLSSVKATEEVTYHVDNRLLKFHPDKQVTLNRWTRAQALGGLVTEGLVHTECIFANHWQPGRNLYQHDSLDLYHRFLDHLREVIDSDPPFRGHAGPQNTLYRFYAEKTHDRLVAFAQRYSPDSMTIAYRINDRDHPALYDLMDRFDFHDLETNPLYRLFHGDLHFDNVIYDELKHRFVYIDWRESFGGETRWGDLYYDLGKLYAGCLVPFELLKDESSLTLSEGASTVSYSYPISGVLRTFLPEYEAWLLHRGFDLKRVRLVAALAFLNISPLHTDQWNKLLFFKGIELLHDATT